MVLTHQKNVRSRRKELGIDATIGPRETRRCDCGDAILSLGELVGGVGKYGRLLGWLYVGDEPISLNEQMIEEGYAWPYDGGTEQKNFEDLREIRRLKGTMI